MNVEIPEKHAQLMVDASEREPDLLWASGFLAVDAFTWLCDRKGSAILLTDLELGRGEKEARVDEVVSLSAVAEQAKEAHGDQPVPFEGVVLHWLKSRGIETVEVPSRFPLLLADSLRQGGIVVEPKPDPFFLDRRLKQEHEVRCLEESQEATEAAMELAIGMIRDSEEGEDRILHLDGDPLTSERIKARVRSFLLDKGLQLGDFIIAPGDQGCDPHDVGSGPIRAGETVICDIYPQHMTHRYWGDMTRTVVKGGASEEQKRMHAAVLEAQETAVSMIRPGACGREIHSKVQEIFDNAGFHTEKRDGQWVGFFHGTGHGLGLDIHEGPRISAVGPPLEEGMVVTVEPGLYYPGLGGCRIEDVVLVTADGCRNFNKASKELEV